MTMCEACELGDHVNCGMQTWCECDCDGPDSIEFAPLDGPPATEPLSERQSDKAMRELIAREIWRYNECPWDFDDPPEGMAQLQKTIALDHAEGIKNVVLASPLFRACMNFQWQTRNG